MSSPMLGSVVSSCARSLLGVALLVGGCASDRQPQEEAETTSDADTAPDTAPDDAAPDATPDVPTDTAIDPGPTCVGESDRDLCAIFTRQCGPLTVTDSCGLERTVASCGDCPDGGWCATGEATTESGIDVAGTCLGRCGSLGVSSCCDGDNLVLCAGGTTGLYPIRCPDLPCGWNAEYGRFTCGGSDTPPAEIAMSCDDYDLPPICYSETNDAFCARVGAECGNPDMTDNCGRYRVYDCGTCAEPRQECNHLGRCTTCGDRVVEVDEDCDDGNLDDSDDCLSSCRWNFYCEDSCNRAHNGICEDFAFDNANRKCDYGADCGDCGVRRDDRCLGFPQGGTCDASVAQRDIAVCDEPLGDSYPWLVLRACRAHEQCVDGATAGTASCALAPEFECELGATRCVTLDDGGEAADACDATGHWRPSDALVRCDDACLPSALGSYCAAGSAARVVTGTITYEYRGPNEDYTAWGRPTTGTLSAGLVVALVSAGDGHVIYDIAPIAPDGSYALRLPPTSRGDDQVAVVLEHVLPDGQATLIAARPDFASVGIRSINQLARVGETSAPWSYITLATRFADAPNLKIREIDGSGAVRVFDVVARAQAEVRAMLGRAGAPLALWLAPNVTWDCVTCFIADMLQVGDQALEASIVVSWNNDKSYWADATTLHELGHWVMASFGTTPGEGGAHFAFSYSLPGLAWSEGFATFFSALARSDPHHFDSSDGTFFSADLGLAAWNEAGPFFPATADGIGYPDRADPLLQRMDEMTVAAMCWSITANMATAIFDGAPPTLAVEGAWVLDALISPRMNVARNDPEARFARGYVRHTWGYDAYYQLVGIRPHPTQSAPMLADFLDALRCLADDLPAIGDGATRDAIIAPAIGAYPYPLDEAPRCQEAPSIPLKLTLSAPANATSGMTLRLEIWRARPDDAPMDLHVALPAGVSLVGKANEQIHDSNNGLVVRELRLRFDQIPKDDIVVTLDVDALAYKLHAQRAYRFGRPEPLAATPHTRVLRGAGGPGARRLLVPVVLGAAPYTETHWK